MTIRWIETGRIGALTDEQRFSEARSYFPPCYSEEFDRCINKTGPTSYPNCARLNELWGTNTSDPVNQKLEAEVHKIPYCSVPEKTETNLVPLIVAGVAGVIGGLFLSQVLR